MPSAAMMKFTHKVGDKLLCGWLLPLGLTVVLKVIAPIAALLVVA
jgi:hypothetical protein